MIEISAETIERVNKVLAGVPKGAEKALSAAMNRGLAKVRTTALKKTRQIYTVNYSALRTATSTRTKNTSSGNLAGYVSFSGVKIPLYKFKVTPTAVATGKKVHAAVKVGGGTTFQDAFVAMMGSGHIGVFERTGVQGIKSRTSQYGTQTKHTEKVSEIMGLSAAQMIANEQIMEQIETDAQQTVNGRLEHEIDRILNGYGGK